MDEKLAAKTAPPKKKWTEFFKGKTGQRLIIAAGILGIALILLSEFWPKGDQDHVGKGIGGGIRDKNGGKAESNRGQHPGAGQCQVMVTLENGVEYVYASQQKVNTDRTEDTASDSNKISQRDGTEQNIIIVDTDNGRQGLLVTEIQPTVKGVVVVCEGGTFLRSSSGSLRR